MTDASTVKTTDFEQSTIVNAPAQGIFDFIADVRNVPQYLPTVKSAQHQEGERIRAQGQAGDRSYDSDGHFRLDRQARRIEWGSDGENDYRSWMQVQDQDESQSQVTVAIHYAPRPEVAQHMAQQSPEHSFESAMNEGIAKTLASIKRICEGQGGKVEIEANQ
ncbi:MAG: SRPBCC family protein [Phormidesmis sp. CAN_BIN44]|nr:SRPBCC family protein [Phormidesmis sp. CAN_BIN44]